MSLWLTAAQIADLTHKSRPGWQARELTKLGIPWRRRTDGTLLVLTSDAGGMQSPATPARRAPQVRLDS